MLMHTLLPFRIVLHELRLDASGLRHVQQVSRINKYASMHACVGGGAVLALSVAF